MHLVARVRELACVCVCVRVCVRVVVGCRLLNAATTFRPQMLSATINYPPPPGITSDVSAYWETPEFSTTPANGLLPVCADLTHDAYHAGVYACVRHA